MGVKETFGSRLKQLRGPSMNQKELADALKISRASIGYYENGTRTPDIEILEKASQYFNVSYDYLMGQTEVKHRENIDISERTGLSEKAILLLTALKENTVKDNDDSFIATAQIRFINSLLEDGYSLEEISINASDYEYIKNHAKPDESLTREELGDFIQESVKKFGLTFRYTTGFGSLDVLFFNCQQYFTNFISNLTYERDAAKDSDPDAT